MVLAPVDQSVPNASFTPFWQNLGRWDTTYKESYDFSEFILSASEVSHKIICKLRPG